MGVEFGGIVGFVDFRADLVLFLLAASFCDSFLGWTYPFLARSVFGRTVGMEGLGAHGVDGLVVSSRHFDDFFVFQKW